MRKIADADELQGELNRLLTYSQTGRPSRSRIASQLSDLSKRLLGREKTAALLDGPIGRVLHDHWNTVHDIAYDLKQTIRDYDDAAHFMDGPAERDAEGMIKEIEGCLKQLEGITSGDKSAFGKLAEAEEAFMKKHGEPSAYANDMRRKTFPR